MKGTMEGLFLNRTVVDESGAVTEPGDIELLASAGGMEIMRLHINAGATAWLSPANEPDTLEYFFLHSGQLVLVTEEGEIRVMPGESFHICRLKSTITLRAEQDALLVYVSNSPMLQDYMNFKNEHEELLKLIQSKDNYTHTHCLNVMRYSLRIYERLRSQNIKLTLSMEEMAIAAMFHDIGKINVPDEILLKRGKLTDEEFSRIKLHSAYGAELLMPVYGERISDIVLSHHERLDGSGYPQGRRGDEIAIEAQILAVTDSFDAMTTNRGYQKAKPAAVSIAELCSLTDKLDKNVTTALRDLAESGELWEGLVQPAPEAG